jgi:hypothetical protein
MFCPEIGLESIQEFFQASEMSYLKALFNACKSWFLFVVVPIEA